MRQFVGPIGANGQIETDAVLFTIEPAGLGRESVEPRSATAILELPAIVGHAPATARKLASHAALQTPMRRTRRHPCRGPLKITFERVQSAHGAPDELQIVRACDAAGNTILPSELALRLQTLSSSKGHWLNTGAITIAAVGETRG